MIGSAALKWCVDFISEPLSHVCNMSLQEWIFPDELKNANVIPLYKCDDLKLFNNYRPVSVLPSANKISRTIGILRRLKNILPTPVLLTLYNTLILPHFHYGLLNWGFSMGRLQLLQKKSVRVISSSKYNAHTDPLFKKLRLIKLADLFTLNVLKMYYKFKHACLPSHVENMFVEFSRNHEHETRQSLILEEPMVNTASGENCLRYILPRIINKTNPTIIKIIDSHSFEGFVRYLKNYMIIHYVDYCVIPNCYICNHMNP